MQTALFPEPQQSAPNFMKQAPRLLHKMRVVREAALEYESCQVMRRKITKSCDVFQMFQNYCNSLDREEFQIIALDVKHDVIGWQTASIGLLDTALVAPREVFKFAILSNAAQLIFVHNHPTGNPAPSEGDILLTARLCDAGRLLGIPIVDHIICGSREFYSFADHGRIVR